MGRIRTILAVALVAVSVWLAYDNVLSDVAPTQALAEKAACTRKDEKLRHGLTRMDRSPLGQSFEFTWESGAVNVECRRQYLLVGPVVCTAK